MFSRIFKAPKYKQQQQQVQRVFCIKFGYMSRVQFFIDLKITKLTRFTTIQSLFVTFK